VTIDRFSILSRFQGVLQGTIRSLALNELSRLRLLKRRDFLDFSISLYIGLYRFFRNLLIRVGLPEETCESLNSSHVRSTADCLRLSASGPHCRL